MAEVGEYAPEVILLNSHDRSSGYKPKREKSPRLCVR